MDSAEGEVIPCLGLAYANLMTSRFLIRKTKNYTPIAVAGSSTNTDLSQLPVRTFEIVFSPESKRTKVQFVITKTGVTSTRDAEKLSLY